MLPPCSSLVTFILFVAKTVAIQHLKLKVENSSRPSNDIIAGNGRVLKFYLFIVVQKYDYGQSYLGVMEDSQRVLSIAGAELD